MRARARRSELATPASNLRMLSKAPYSGADMVFMDLEDALRAQREGSSAGELSRPCSTSTTGAASCGRSG